VALNNYYFCLQINEANVFQDISDGGEALVWCDVIWNGVRKESRRYKKSNVD